MFILYYLYIVKIIHIDNGLLLHCNLVRKKEEFVILQHIERRAL